MILIIFQKLTFEKNQKDRCLLPTQEKNTQLACRTRIPTRNRS
jgi:hypothetical protein